MLSNAHLFKNLRQGHCWHGVGARRGTKTAVRVPPSSTSSKSRPVPRIDPHRYMAFYKYARIPSPEVACEDLRRRLSVLGGLGRIYVSKEGINAQMSIPVPCEQAWLWSLQQYCDQWGIGDVQLNVGGIESMAREEERPFTKLTVKLRDRLVQDALPPSINQQLDMSCVSQLSITPDEWHAKFRRMDRERRGEKIEDVADPIGIHTPIKRNDLDTESSTSTSDTASTRQASQSSPTPPEFCQNTNNGLDDSRSSSSVTDSEHPIILDCRNWYESEIGKFDHAIRLPVDRYSESFDAVDQILANTPLDREILLYCTGGIRCEKIGAYLTQVRGRKNVKTLKGGINNYHRFISQQRLATIPTYRVEDGIKPVPSNDSQEDLSLATETKKSEMESEPHESDLSPLRGFASDIGLDVESYYRGINYQFDKRNRFGLNEERVTGDILGKCWSCRQPCDHYHNCANPICNVLVILCDSCHSASHGACSESCKSIASLPVEAQRAKQRQEKIQLARKLASRQQSTEESLLSSSLNTIGAKELEGQLKSEDGLPSTPVSSFFIRSKSYLRDILGQEDAPEYRMKVLEAKGIFLPEVNPNGTQDDEMMERGVKMMERDGEGRKGMMGHHQQKNAEEIFRAMAEDMSGAISGVMSGVMSEAMSESSGISKRLTKKQSKRERRKARLLAKILEELNSFREDMTGESSTFPSSISSTSTSTTSTSSSSSSTSSSSRPPSNYSSSTSNNSLAFDHLHRLNGWARITPFDVQRYVESHTTPPSASLRQLDWEDPRKELSVGAYEGEWLRWLVRMQGASRVLELGAYLGYSALTMAEGLAEVHALSPWQRASQHEKREVGEEGEASGTKNASEVSNMASNLSSNLSSNMSSNLSSNLSSPSNPFSLFSNTSNPFVISCDLDHISLARARHNALHHPYGHLVHFIHQSGLKTLADAAQRRMQFDFIFIDADKQNLVNYYNLIVDNHLLAPSGLLIVDNTLWRGEVTSYDKQQGEEINSGSPCSNNKSSQSSSKSSSQSSSDDYSAPKVHVVHAFNNMVSKDPRVEQIMLPLRDGMTLVRWKSNPTQPPLSRPTL